VAKSAGEVRPAGKPGDRSVAAPSDLLVKASVN
jgi:hypothetical protein